MASRGVPLRINSSATAVARSSETLKLTRARSAPVRAPAPRLACPTRRMRPPIRAWATASLATISLSPAPSVDEPWPKRRTATSVSAPGASPTAVNTAATAASVGPARAAASRAWTAVVGPEAPNISSKVGSSCGTAGTSGADAAGAMPETCPAGSRSSIAASTARTGSDEPGPTASARSAAMTGTPAASRSDRATSDWTATAFMAGSVADMSGSTAAPSPGAVPSSARTASPARSASTRSASNDSAIRSISSRVETSSGASGTSESLG